MAPLFEVEFTDELEVFWDSISASWQDEIDKVIHLLEECGPRISRQYSQPINGSVFSHMMELRIQCQGHPIRILYAFDPRRVAILLCGGDKKGDDRWYDKNVSKADELYRQHLLQLDKERE